MRAQNASDVDRVQNTGFSTHRTDFRKKFFKNLYEGISRVNRKVSILSYRFLRNFFLSPLRCDYGLVRIGLPAKYGMVLSGEAKNQSKSLMSDFGELGLFEKIFKNLKNLAGP